MQNKKILVTGGGGFIPSHVVRRLVKRGHDVSVLVKYNSLIDNIRLVDVWDNINVIEADLRNLDALQQINSLKPEIIIHMAAYNHVGDSFINSNEALISNGVGTANLLNSYDDYELFLYTSTSEVYGYQTSVPFVETMNPAPISPYSIGKYAGELYARMLATEQNKPIAILRPFNTFGPYQSPRAIIGELIIKCIKNEIIETTIGDQTREFNYVDNIVDAYMLAIEKKENVYVEDLDKFYNFILQNYDKIQFTDENVLLETDEMVKEYSNLFNKMIASATELTNFRDGKAETMKNFINESKVELNGKE